MVFPPSLLIISVFIGTVGQILLKIGAAQLVPISFNLPQLPLTLVRTFSNPWILAGTFIYATSMVTWLKVISTMELSLAYPMVSLSYVLVLILSYIFLGEHITLSKLLGVTAIMTGVFIIGK